jgi:KDO2-lipid IV(A) lauroyltransferase
MLFYWLVPKRRHIAHVNINLCFPEKSLSERKALVKDSFKSLGMGAIEAFIAWFMPERRFKKIPFHWIGEASTMAFIKNAQHAMTISGHFTCLEIAGRFFGQCFSGYGMPLNLVHKQSHHPLFEYLMTKGRSPYSESLIKHTNVKGMVRCLRERKVLWYAPDQDFGLSRSVWTTFFGIPTATVPGVSVLARVGHAEVIPVFFRRLPTGGYEGLSFEPLTNFPSGDDVADAQRWQSLLEEYIRKYPDQYLWIHRRFKTRPEGSASVY